MSVRPPSAVACTSTVCVRRDFPGPTQPGESGFLPQRVGWQLGSESGLGWNLEPVSTGNTFPPAQATESFQLGNLSIATPRILKGRGVVIPLTRNPQLSTRKGPALTGGPQLPAVAKAAHTGSRHLLPLGEIGKRPSHFCNSASAFFTFCASALSGLSFRYAL
jgi:hypothetical protein